MASGQVQVDCADIPTAQLVADYRALSQELEHRGVLKPDRQAVARFAEWLVARYLQSIGRPTERTRRGADLATSEGEIIEVKTVVDRPSRAPAITLKKLDFDLLAVVVLRDDLHPIAAYFLPRERVEAMSKRHETGWTLRVTPAVSADPAVVNATAEIQALAEAA